MKKLYITVVFVLNFVLGFAQHEISFTDENNLLSIGKGVYFYEDKEGKLTIDDVIQEGFQHKFERSKVDEPNLGTTKSVYWCRFTISNYTHEEILLEITGSTIHHIDFYSLDSAGRYYVRQTGTLRPFDTREFDTNVFLFRLLQAQQFHPKTFFVRFDSEHTLETPMKVGTIENFLEYNHRLDLFYGFYFGLMLVMVLYNLFVFFTAKDISYLYYILYLLGAVLINAFLLGNYAFEWIWRSFHWFNHYFLFLAGFAPLVGILFSMRFLYTDKYVPTLHKILKAFLFIIPIFQFLNLIGFYAEIVDPFQAVISLPLIFMLWSAFAVHRKGHKTAIWFALGWLFYIISIVVFVMTLQGVLPGNFFFKNSVIVGQEIEVILFAFALGGKINLYRKEKEQAQAEALFKAQENERLVREQNAILEEKVTERTLELAEKNTLLEIQYEDSKQKQEELQAMNEELNHQRTAIEKHRAALENAYKHVRSSIEYAKRIQDAMLPFDERIAQSLREFFIFYRPKDIVSGDFYWFQDLEVKALQKLTASDNPKEETIHKIVLAVGDCTGHGVPGAFMSMIGNELLNQIVNINRITEPDRILNNLHKGIRYALKQHETENRDGMDILICTIDLRNKLLEYAGAMQPFHYVQDGVLHTIKGNKFPIGGFQREMERVFTKHTIDISKPTSIYLATDGYQDQFGGQEDTKFLSKNFKRLLEKIYDHPVEEQRKALEQAFLHWKGDTKQTDDITIFGIKL